MFRKNDRGEKTMSRYRQKNPFRISPEDPQPVCHEIKHRIYFSETDALGIVWHGNYAVFFERAITELGHRIGLSVDALKNANLATPLAQLHIDYKIPLYLDEEVTTKVKLYWSEGAILQYETCIINSRGEIACTGHVIQMFVDLTTREPMFLSPELWEECRKNWKAGKFANG